MVINVSKKSYFPVGDLVSSLNQNTILAPSMKLNASPASADARRVLPAPSPTMRHNPQSETPMSDRASESL